jgi:GrpB-like predicted nucleotidyltransferase (UPF0157 family)
MALREGEVMGVPTGSRQVVEVVDYDPAWPALFGETGRALRDYRRHHDDEAAEFAAVKRRLAEQFRHDRHGYTDAKNPYVWSVIRRADEWAQLQGWAPGPIDA